MKQQIAHIALVVEDYDKAIFYYTQKLNFILLQDIPQSDTKRWVVVSPPGSECSLLLAKAVGDEQQKRIGNQTGGRVFLFLKTDNFWRDYTSMKGKEIIFKGEPRVEDYGTVVVFEDLYGNRWDLIGPVS